MPTIKTYRKVGAFYIACEEDFATSIRIRSVFGALSARFAEVKSSPTRADGALPSSAVGA